MKALVDHDLATLLLGDSLEVLAALEPESIDAVVTDPPYLIGFMGREWDADDGVAGRAEFWREVLRVLKPGGHLLAFGATRTYHRVASAIEDAGFEVRDSLHWIYGTGFPKSLDVSKALDKAAGAEREVVGQADRKSSLGSLGRYGSGLISHTPEITAPATDAAKAWSGWGTALKPAHEPVVMARKPLAGTVAENVQAHGTGALNVDGCRISTEGESFQAPQSDPKSRAGTVGTNLGISAASLEKFQASQRASIQRTQDLGRWPANVLLSHAETCTVPPEPGATCSTGCPVGELGDPARFFYVSKPSRREREFGCEGLPSRVVNVETPPGTLGANSPRAGAGRTGGARNFHPTVKPIDLMRYLCRLVTPPGGVVLDPFAGSCTTGIAALREGFRFVGVERSEEYAPIAVARLSAALREVSP